MSTSSNKWTIRRRRHPRPAVCKSKDPYENWPKLVQFTLQWAISNPFAPSTWSGATFAVRFPKTICYATAGTDFQGGVWTMLAIIPLQTGPIAEQTALCFVTITTSNGTTYLLNGSNFAWWPPGLSHPPPKPLSLPGTGDVGSWFHDLPAKP